MTRIDDIINFFCEFKNLTADGIKDLLYSQKALSQSMSVVGG